jgi:hypothetical protein
MHPTCGALSGSCRFSDGSPCANITIQAKPLQGGGLYETLTDANGAFNLYVPPGTFLISATVQSPGNTFTYVRPQLLTVTGEILCK